MKRWPFFLRTKWVCSCKGGFLICGTVCKCSNVESGVGERGRRQGESHDGSETKRGDWVTAVAHQCPI